MLPQSRGDSAAFPPTDPMEAAEQLTLLQPDHRPRGRLRMVPVAAIIPGDTPASLALVEDIGQHGVHDSLALIAHGDRFLIADGERRHDAALQAGEEEVPAMVFPEGTPKWMAASITLARNLLRAPNHLRELSAIQDLLPEVGGDPNALALRLRIAPGTVKKRLRLLGLVPELTTALRGGRLSVKAAYRAASMTPSTQRELARVLEAEERITSAHVRAVNAARRADAEQQILSILAQVDTPAPDPRAMAEAEASARSELRRLEVYVAEHYAGAGLATEGGVIDQVLYLLRHHAQAPATPAIERTAALLDAAHAAAREGETEALRSLADRIEPVAETAHQVLEAMATPVNEAGRRRRQAAPPIPLHRASEGGA